jgi:hypothetical protein
VHRTFGAYKLTLTSELVRYSRQDDVQVGSGDKNCLHSIEDGLRAILAPRKRLLNTAVERKPEYVPASALL